MKYGDKKIGVVGIKSFTMSSTLDNFWTVGYTPKQICATSDSKYIMGISESVRDSVFTLASYDLYSGGYNITKREISSKQRWIGMDLTFLESCMIGCYLLDTRSASSKNSNYQIYPFALCLGLFEFKSQRLGTNFTQEFFETKHQKANLMVRDKQSDMIFVGGFDCVSVFVLLNQKKFVTLRFITGFGDYLVREIFYGNKVLVLAVDGSSKGEVPFIVVKFEGADLSNSDTRIQQAVFEITSKTQRIEALSQLFLQPNFIIHSYKKYKGELWKYQTELSCVKSIREDRVVIGNLKGLASFTKNESHQLVEQGLSSTGYDIMSMKTLQNGRTLVHTSTQRSLYLLDNYCTEISRLSMSKELSLDGRGIQPFKSYSSHDEDFHLWFQKYNLICLVSVQAGVLMAGSSPINLSRILTRNEHPMAVCTAFEKGYLLVLYVSESNGTDVPSQLLVQATNILESPVFQVIDPKRLFYLSSLE